MTKVRIPWVRPEKRLGDIVPAMLEPQEVVLPIPVVDKLNKFTKSKSKVMSPELKHKLKDLIELVPDSNHLRKGGRVTRKRAKVINKSMQQNVRVSVNIDSKKYKKSTKPRTIKAQAPQIITLAPQITFPNYVPHQSFTFDTTAPFNKLQTNVTQAESLFKTGQPQVITPETPLQKLFDQPESKVSQPDYSKMQAKEIKQPFMTTFGVNAATMKKGGYTKEFMINVFNQYAQSGKSASEFYKEYVQKNPPIKQVRVKKEN